MEVYQITEYWFNWYYLGNGYFDWEGYYNHVPDGPAFDGAEWLVLHGDWETGTLMQAFMWYTDNVCYFSLGEPYSESPEFSGTCTIEGHETTTYDYEVTDIIWYFDSAPWESRKFVYQAGEWGPIAEMTSERYYIGGGDDFWLWQKPSGHCEVCGEGSGYDWESIFPSGEVSEAEVEVPEIIEDEILGGDDTVAPVLGAEIKSVWHCDSDCRSGNGEPDEGMFAFFDCAAAEAQAGCGLLDNTEHTVLVNGVLSYDIYLWTTADTWTRSSDGTNDCVVRVHPYNEAAEGQWAVGDTLEFPADSCGAEHQEVIAEAEAVEVEEVSASTAEVVEEVADVSDLLATCDTTTLTDAYGDGCDYYVSNPYDCGYYDTDEFVANELCCACLA